MHLVHAQTPTRSTGTARSAIAALLLTVTAVTATTWGALPASADVAVDDPFLWMDSGAPAPAPERPAVTEKYEPAAPAPMAQPVPQPQPAPQAMASNCYYPDGRPMTLDFPNGPMLSADAGRQGNAYDSRRGYMAGDDGVLRGIQDNPCAEIYRRGGETPESAAGWLHPHDIRRVNTLEDRRIPIQTVGRYSAGNDDVWYTDPANPFADAPREWDVREGETLSTLLRRWGAEAGFTIVYETPNDYILQANVVLRGTFPEAAGEVIESFANAQPPIAADFYIGNRVLVVRPSGDFDGR